MATYAIGDLQGCLQPLQALLDKIEFDKTKDSLWFVGDLINRGPQSLETLRFVKSLDPIVSLGNHDLHLLAVAYDTEPKKKYDTLNEILEAPDKIDLIEWLRHRPMLHTNNSHVMTHAGLAPAWTVDQARYLAKEVEELLQGPEVKFYLENMYGNTPNQWRDDLTDVQRFRCIVNYFTRMRYCYQDGSLELEFKGRLTDKPKDLVPWYLVPNRKNTDAKIVFGHWAALDGKTNTKNIFAIDTGCVWGRCLTALRLEDEKKFDVKCD